MDTQLFVQNVKKYCEMRGVKPTVASRESGIGTSFINNIEAKGSIPSVEKVQQLAAYLGVTTSELLGEAVSKTEATMDTLTEAENRLLRFMRDLNDEGQERVIEYAEGLVAAGRYKKGGQHQLAHEA